MQVIIYLLVGRFKTKDRWLPMLISGWIGFICRAHLYWVVMLSYLARVRILVVCHWEVVIRRIWMSVYRLKLR